MRAYFIFRTRFVLGVIVFIAAVLVIRLYFLQIVHGAEYKNEALSQYVTTHVSYYDRGKIFISNKNGTKEPVALVDSGYKIAIKPKDITDAEVLYGQLSNIIELDESNFLRRASNRNDPYEEIVRYLTLTPEQVKALRKLDSEGVLLLPDQWRTYPGGTLAAHTIGFVAYQGDEQAGRYGLERYYEDILQRTQNDLYVNFFAEIFADVTEGPLIGGGQKAGDIITSIEPSVQLQLQNVLQEVHTKWRSRLSAGIVMDPHTGEIQALAVYPVFDANNFSQAENVTVFSNPLVEGVYEMGSIIKPLTMAAGIDAGVVNEKTTYNDTGHLTLDGYTISNYDGKARGVVPMQEVLSQSLNTGAAFVANRIGNDRFREYLLEKYKIGDETGIDLPSEAAGLVSNLDNSRDIEYATASYGQGIAMTPIATIRALATLASGGKLVQPHLVKRIEYEGAFDQTIDYDDAKTQAISKEAAEVVTRMLVNVVDETLVGGEVKLEHYSVAAKTGTAQIANSRGGGYYDDRFLHSFFGYAPAFDPEFIVFLMTIEPKGALYASQTLTEPFMGMTEFILNYYDIPPDR